MPRPVPCRVKTQLPQSQRCTSLASLPRFKLFLEICAGGVHNQLWQKTSVEETGESLTDRNFPSCAFVNCVVRAVCRYLQARRVDYLLRLGENKWCHPHESEVSLKVGLW